MRKKHLNVGSAIIETTLLIPILLGIVVLYIYLFIFLIDVSKSRKDMVEILYAIDYTERKENGTLSSGKKRMKMEQGSKISVFEKVEFSVFEVSLELHRNEDFAVENIRRWQLVADTIRKRKEK